MEVDSTGSGSPVVCNKIIEYQRTGLVKQGDATSFGIGIIIFDPVVPDGDVAVETADSAAGEVGEITGKCVPFDPGIGTFAADPAAATSASPSVSRIVPDDVIDYRGV